MKNQYDGERFVTLSEEVCELLDDWVECTRPAVTGNHDREPLVSTPQPVLQRSERIIIGTPDHVW